MEQEAKPYESKLLARLMRDAEVPGIPWEVESADVDAERCVLRLPDSKDTVEVYWSSDHDAHDPWAFGFGWGLYTPDGESERQARVKGQGRLHYNTTVREARKVLREAGLEPMGPPETRKPLWPGGPEWREWKDWDRYSVTYHVDGYTVELQADLVHKRDGWALSTMDARELEKARRQAVELPLVQFQAARKLADKHGHHWAEALARASNLAGMAPEQVEGDEQELLILYRLFVKALDAGRIPLKLIDDIADKTPCGPVPGTDLQLRWPTSDSTAPWLEHTTTTGRLHWCVNTQGVVLLEVHRPQGRVLAATVRPEDGTVNLARGAQLYGLRHVQALLNVLEALDVQVSAGELYPLTRGLDAMQVALDLATKSDPPATLKPDDVPVES